jgi:hypothetical protein
MVDSTNNLYICILDSLFKGTIIISWLCYQSLPLPFLCKSNFKKGVWNNYISIIIYMISYNTMLF